MVQSAAVWLVPIIATFWMCAGCLGLAVVTGISVYTFALRKPYRAEDACEDGKPRDDAKFFLFFGAWSLFFVVTGFVCLHFAKQRPGAVLALIGFLSLLGAIATFFFLWPALRRRP
jgi:hypothetical protein